MAPFWPTVRRSPATIENVRYIIDHEADLHASDAYRNTQAMNTIHSGDSELLQVFIDAGSLMDITRKTGTAVLHAAAWCGSSETWKILV
jgi:hypothetical protein